MEEAQGHEGKLLFKSETSDTITEKRNGQEGTLLSLLYMFVVSSYVFNNMHFFITCFNSYSSTYVSSVKAVFFLLLNKKIN